jgi:hypothetical protein
MKKILAILLVLFVAGFVFADNNNATDLELSTAVGGRWEVMVSDDNLEGDNTGESLGNWGDANVVTELAFPTGAETRSAYISILTNRRVQAEVTVTANPLASVDTTTKIGYTVSFEDESYSSITVGKGDTNKSGVLFKEDAIYNGMRVKSNKFSVNLNATDYQDATAAANYTTTWTINLNII